MYGNVKYLSQVEDCRSLKNDEKNIFIDFTRNHSIQLEKNQLDIAIKNNRSKWAKEIQKWLADLNVLNNEVYWWAYPFTAKNPLSSMLLNRLIDLNACIHIIKNNPNKKIYIYGITNKQRAVINSFLFENGRGTILKILNHAIKMVNAIARSFFNVFRVWIFFFKTKNVDKNLGFDIGLFTYIDGSNRKTKDPYFGKLKSKLETLNPELKVMYISYIYSPYKIRINEIHKIERKSHVLFFDYLVMRDYVWVLGKCIRQLIFNKYVYDKNNKLNYLKSVLDEIMVEELPNGYLYNLLSYRSAIRMSENKKIKKFIYPFENKSLEKCVILGLNKEVKTIGYQHSSITKRHGSFILENDEAKITPLPDKIITLGNITANWLINKGGFPVNKINVGYSLRHDCGNTIVKRKIDINSVNLLLALSSSRHELINSILFIKSLIKENDALKVGIRTHPEFPVSILNENLLKWVKENLVLLNEYSLKENFEWTDITLYISSTVALESLMYGIPVIKLDIDIADSDPVLGNPPYSWKAETPKQCYEVIQLIAKLSLDEKNKYINQSQEYINSYIIPEDKGSEKIFLN